MQRRRVIVQGQVQGVGFRWSAAREAERLGLGGWVTNRDDGTVEVVIEGHDASVDAMLIWLSHGPRGAHVTGTQIHTEPPEGMTSFGVRQ